MQTVAMIPEREWREMLSRQTKLENEISYLKKSMASYVGTEEAMRMTGLCRDQLYNHRQAGNVEFKFKGRIVQYLRSSLEALNDSGKLRRKRTSSKTPNQ